MNSRENYKPGPATGAEIRKDGEKWTLVLVRELRHPPAKVWQALTDPAQLREWAPLTPTRASARPNDGEASRPSETPAQYVRNPCDASGRAERARVQLGRPGYALGAPGVRRRHTPRRSGPTSIAATSQWVPPGGTSASMSWITFSMEFTSAASWVPRR